MENPLKPVPPRQRGLKRGGTVGPGRGHKKPETKAKELLARADTATVEALRAEALALAMPRLKEAAAIIDSGESESAKVSALALLLKVAVPDQSEDVTKRIVPPAVVRDRVLKLLNGRLATG